MNTKRGLTQEQREIYYAIDAERPEAEPEAWYVTYYGDDDLDEGSEMTFYASELSYREIKLEALKIIELKGKLPHKIYEA